MYFATESTRTRIGVWLAWTLVLFACLSTPSSFSLEVNPAPAVAVAATALEMLGHLASLAPVRLRAKTQADKALIVLANS